MSTLRKKRLERPGAPGGKRDENRRRRVQALKKAGLDLFLARGIETVTIDEIAARAKMAKGGFYLYFADKPALVDAILAPLRDAAIAAFAQAEDAIAAAADRESLLLAYGMLGAGLGAAVVGDPQAAQLYLQESRGPKSGARAPARKLADRIRARSLELTHLAHDRGLLRPFDPRISALAVVGAAEAMLGALLAEEDLGNPFELPEKLTGLFMDGLKPRDRGIAAL